MVGAWNGGLGDVGDVDLEGDPWTCAHRRYSPDRGWRGDAQHRPQLLSKTIRRGLFSRVCGKVILGTSHRRRSEKFATRKQRPSNTKDSYFRGYAGRTGDLCYLRHVASGRCVKVIRHKVEA